MQFTGARNAGQVVINVCGKFTTNNDGMSVTMRSRPNGGYWRRRRGKRSTRIRRALWCPLGRKSLMLRRFFSAGAMLATLTALRPGAAADAAPKLTADEYIEI